MKSGDIFYLYDYRLTKEYRGTVKLIKKLDDRWNQEKWLVKKGIGEIEVWLDKPIEWHRVDSILPFKGKNPFSIPLLVIGYDIDNRLKYEFSRYDFEKKIWIDISSIQDVIYWKYPENTPLSLVKNIKGDKNG